MRITRYGYASCKFSPSIIASNIFQQASELKQKTKT